MSDNVLHFPIIGRPIPRPVLVTGDGPKASKLSELVAMVRSFGGTPEKARVAAMARQSVILMTWVSDTCSVIDVEFAEEQLRAALKAVETHKPVNPR